MRTRDPEIPGSILCFGKKRCRKDETNLARDETISAHPRKTPETGASYLLHNERRRATHLGAHIQGDIP
jgi:hypothetical protein